MPMKRKLKIEDLAVVSFSTAEDMARARGTVHGASGVTACWQSLLVPESCVYLCPRTQDTCYATCDDRTCLGSCPPQCP